MQMGLVMQIHSFWHEMDRNEPCFNFQYCFQSDQIILENVPLVLDKPCVRVSIEPYYRNEPLVRG